MLFKWYRIGWTDEGRFWRKKGWTIRKPINGSDKAVYQLRKVGSLPGKKDFWEDDYLTLKDAMKAGNRAIRSSK